MLAGEEAWVVGGAVRDELLGQAGRRPRRRLRTSPSVPRGRYVAARSGERGLPALGRHGGWRVVARRGAGRSTSRPLQGGSIEADLAARDFTVNAIAVPLAGGEPVDPFGGRADLERQAAPAGVAGASSTTTRCGCCAPCASRTSSAFRLDPDASGSSASEAGLVGRPAGERILDELAPPLGRRLRAARRARPARAARRRGRPAAARVRLALVPARGRVRAGRSGGLPVSGELRRFAPHARAPSRRPTARRGRSTASAARPSRGRSRRSPSPAPSELADGGRARRGAASPPEPLLRGDELGIAAGAGGRAACSSSSPRSARQAPSRPERRRWSLSGDRWSRTAAQLAELEESRRGGADRARPALRPAGGRRARARRRHRNGGARVRALAARREVVGRRPLARAPRGGARGGPGPFPNVTFVEGDATGLDLESGIVRPRRLRADAPSRPPARSWWSPSSPG